MQTRAKQLVPRAKSAQSRPANTEHAAHAHACNVGAASARQTSRLHSVACAQLDSTHKRCCAPLLRRFVVSACNANHEPSAITPTLPPAMQHDGRTRQHTAGETPRTVLHVTTCRSHVQPWLARHRAAALQSTMQRCACMHIAARDPAPCPSNTCVLDRVASATKRRDTCSGRIVTVKGNQMVISLHRGGPAALRHQATAKDSLMYHDR